MIILIRWTICISACRTSSITQTCIITITNHTRTTLCVSGSSVQCLTPSNSSMIFAPRCTRFQEKAMIQLNKGRCVIMKMKKAVWICLESTREALICINTSLSQLSKRLRLSQALSLKRQRKKPNPSLATSISYLPRIIQVASNKRIVSKLMLLEPSLNNNTCNLTT